MIERSNVEEMNDQTLASFKISHDLWQHFRARCIERETTASKVLSQLIIDYLEEIDNPAQQKSSPSANQNIDQLITEKLRDLVENYLVQNLEPYILRKVENRLTPLIQETVDKHLSSNIGVTSAPISSFEDIQATPLQKPKTTTLKTARELGEILGVSAPYITTLNRIGELQERGWEDSGERRGKSVLYKPVDSAQ